MTKDLNRYITKEIQVAEIPHENMVNIISY